MIDTKNLSIRTRHHILNRFQYLDVKFAILPGTCLHIRDEVTRTFGVPLLVALKIDYYHWRLFDFNKTQDKELKAFCVLRGLNWEGYQLPSWLELYPSGYEGRALTPLNDKAIAYALAGI